MNRNLMLVCSLLLMLIASDATARDTVKPWPFADVLNNPEYAKRLTNGFNKTDEEACQWVMLTALLQLHQRAQILGANAIVNIRSNYKNNETSSETEYTCGSGALMSGVALIGTFVTIE